MALRLWVIGLGVTALLLGAASIRIARNASEAILVSLAGF